MRASVGLLIFATILQVSAVSWVTAERSRAAPDGGTPTPTPALPETALYVPPSQSGTTATTSSMLSGSATWYCGSGSSCTRGYRPGSMVAAAGPRLRHGDWRGSFVDVCLAADRSRCVVVQLVDWCSCPNTVLDLYRAVFAKLADPGRGRIRVVVTTGTPNPIATLPPTDTER